jgi:hypothetical protein
MMSTLMWKREVKIEIRDEEKDVTTSRGEPIGLVLSIVHLTCK